VRYPHTPQPPIIEMIPVCGIIGHRTLEEEPGEAL
jgi:hypothetical protein